MFYTAQSGIWQSVWYEWVPENYVINYKITPEYNKASDVYKRQGVGYSVIAFLIAVFFGGPLAQLFVDGGEAEIIANVRAFLLWKMCIRDRCATAWYPADVS